MPKQACLLTCLEKSDKIVVNLAQSRKNCGKFRTILYLFPKHFFNHAFLGTKLSLALLCIASKKCFKTEKHYLAGKVKKSKSISSGGTGYLSSGNAASVSGTSF